MSEMSWCHVRDTSGTSVHKTYVACSDIIIVYIY